MVLGGTAGRRILTLVGPGNNGGDGLVAARHLARWGATVILYLATNRRDDDPNLRLALSEGAQLLTATSDDGLNALERALRSSHVVVDAVLGTGRSRPLSGTPADVMARVSKTARLPKDKRPLYVAVDVPTGVDAATGRADPLTPRTDLTLALGFPKVGHFIFPAADYVGVLNTLDIGIPPELSKDISLELITPSWVRQQLPQRGLNGHKGTYGHALIVGGSVNYPGAACLAAGAALRSGVGLVTLAVPQGIYGIAASKFTEAIQLPLPDNGSGCLDPQAFPAIRQALPSYSSLAIGCGMGRSEPAKQFLEGLLLSKQAPSQPLVIDADALNILAESPGWWRRIVSPAVVTPHPGEMSRLTGLSTEADSIPSRGNSPRVRPQVGAGGGPKGRVYSHRSAGRPVPHRPLRQPFAVHRRNRRRAGGNHCRPAGPRHDSRRCRCLRCLPPRGRRRQPTRHPRRPGSHRRRHHQRAPRNYPRHSHGRHVLAPQSSDSRYASSNRSTTWHTRTSAPA